MVAPPVKVTDGHVSADADGLCVVLARTVDTDAAPIALHTEPSAEREASRESGCELDGTLGQRFWTAWVGCHQTKVPAPRASAKITPLYTDGNT